MWHIHGSRTNNRLMFVGRAIDCGDRMAAVVTNKMQHLNAMQRATFSVSVVVLATRNESKQRSQSAHARLHGNFLAAFWGRFWP